MKRSLIIIILALAVSSLVNGQNAVDALRYSQQFMGGTARYMAMGGAFGALGADLSVLSTNPGALGVYKSSDFSFTPSVHVGASNSLYNGYSGSDSKTNFALANAAITYFAVRGEGKWQKQFPVQTVMTLAPNASPICQIRYLNIRRFKLEMNS